MFKYLELFDNQRAFIRWIIATKKMDYDRFKVDLIIWEEINDKRNN